MDTSIVVSDAGMLTLSTDVDRKFCCSTITTTDSPSKLTRVDIAKLLYGERQVLSISAGAFRIQRALCSAQGNTEYYNTEYNPSTLQHGLTDTSSIHLLPEKARCA